MKSCMWIVYWAFQTYYKIITQLKISKKQNLNNIKNDFDRYYMFIFVSRNDFKREFILRHVRDLKHNKREMPHCSQVNKYMFVSNVSILVSFSVANWLSLQLWFHIWFEMNFLKHEQISLQKYSMLKIVQDKHLIKH